MRIAVLHGEVPKDAPADELDVLVEVGAVSGALKGLGHEPYALPVSLDLESLSAELVRGRPDAAFNLVESLGGKGSLIHLCPAILDTLRLPYTGSGTQAVFLTSGKVLAKRTLEAAGLPTPGWVTPESVSERFVPGTAYIVKSVWEHASIGLEQDSVSVFASADELARAMEAARERLGGECFAEEFIDGREFNLSLIESGGGPLVLPPAEIKFTGFPETARKMVGYRAKWVEDSAEYMNTRRSFMFPETDGILLERMAEISKECWRLFGLGGYARVDFRVDESGRPWVLEVNVNPCISPDSGFVAAAAMAGIGYERLVGRILDASMAGVRNTGALL